MCNPAVLDELLDPLMDAESARRIADFRIAPSVQERVAVLASRANQGTLTSEEQAEYEALVNAADLIAILKLKAQRRLAA